MSEQPLAAGQPEPPPPPAAPNPAAPGYAQLAAPSRPTPAAVAAILRRRALTTMGIGVLLLIAGIVITVLTYSAAASSPTGGTYIVAYGPIIAGVLLLIRGTIVLVRANRIAPR